jgi:hypothetical protein
MKIIFYCSAAMVFARNINNNAAVTTSSTSLVTATTVTLFKMRLAVPEDLGFSSNLHKKVFLLEGTPLFIS